MAASDGSGFRCRVVDVVVRSLVDFLTFRSCSTGDSSADGKMTSSPCDSRLLAWAGSCDVVATGPCDVTLPGSLGAVASAVRRTCLRFGASRFGASFTSHQTECIDNHSVLTLTCNASNL